MIKAIQSDTDLLKAAAALSALRPQINHENIIPIVGGMMRRGYHLIGYEEGVHFASVLGYRFTEHLHWGKVIYIDDLSTLPAFRKRGFALKLLDYVKGIARDTQCHALHLDSGLGSDRYTAHRFYLNYGFNITSHHFALSLK